MRDPALVATARPGIGKADRAAFNATEAPAPAGLSWPPRLSAQGSIRRGSTTCSGASATRADYGRTALRHTMTRESRKRVGNIALIVLGGAMLVRVLLLLLMRG